MNPKFFIGPMSKNVVDAIIEFCEETNNIIGLIPSRRQVEYNGGYVNNWTTKTFTEYVKVKKQSKNKIIHVDKPQPQLQNTNYSYSNLLYESSVAPPDPYCIVT